MEVVWTSNVTSICAWKRFWAKRAGDTSKAKSSKAKADRVWKKLTEWQRSWARKEVMVQIIAKGMNTINETYGW